MTTPAPVGVVVFLGTFSSSTTSRLLCGNASHGPSFGRIGSNVMTGFRTVVTGAIALLTGVVAGGGVVTGDRRTVVSAPEATRDGAVKT